MIETMSEEDSPIKEWYKNKSIFITGGTGFMGKVLVEKLLYSCPGIKNIYLLTRTKRDKTPKQRIEEMWKLPMFERLRKTQPTAIKKIILVIGNLESENLGMSSTDMDILINDVNIVFHLGATLKLEAILADAIEQNLAGTARVIEIAKQMKKLEVFAHFSTAFCSADIEVFEERVYKTKESPRDVMEITKWLNSKALETATPSIIAPHPNTYTYSKRLAETLVADEKDRLPVCIIRPAIVIPAAAEPLPGWVDNLNGPIGLLVGAGKGVIRSMIGKGENQGQFIPVDYAINASICVAYLVGTRQTGLEDVPVYNLTSSSILKLTYQEIMAKGKEIIYDYPFEMQVWYPDGDLRSSKFIHFLYTLFFQWLPALLIDFLLIIFQQKPFMIRIQKKIHRGVALLQFFSLREWVFKSDHFIEIKNKLSEADQKEFIMVEKPDIKEYMKNAILGTRQYCVKEDLSSLPRCRRKQKVLYVIHKLAVYGFYYYIFYLLSCWIPAVKVLFDGMKSTFSYLPVVGGLYATK